MVSRDWSDGKLSLKLDDGAADDRVDLAGDVSRGAKLEGSSLELPKIMHEKVAPEFEDFGSTLTMRTRYLTVTVDRGDVAMTVASGATR